VLRFLDSEIEKGFTNSRTEPFAACCSKTASVLLSAVSACMMVQRFWDTVQYATPEAYKLSRWQLGLELSSTAIYASSMIAAKVLVRTGRIRFFWMELIVILSTILWLVAVTLSIKHYIARAFGHDDPSVVWGIDLAGQDAMFIVLIDVCITALHLFFPIRWIVMLPIEVAGVLLYAVFGFVFGSADPHGFNGNAVALAVLTVMATFGKRSTEYQERRSFADLVSERKKRCEAEFMLSKRQPVQPTPAQDDRSSVTESRVSTTSTGLAFEIDCGSVSLQACCDIGEKEQWLIQSTEVELTRRILGEGGFGIVVEGLYGGTRVAVKAPKDSVVQANGCSGKLAALCNELRILRRLRHPNIIFLYGAIFDREGNKACLVLELIDGASLGSFILGRTFEGGTGSGWDDTPSSSDRVQVVCDVVCALRYLHTRQPPVVHGDLKDSNVFVERCPDARSVHRAKLLDFGLARLLTRKAKPLWGTIRWMAPELVLQRDRPNISADVFSFGRLTFFVVTGVFPLEDIGSREIERRLKQRQPPALQWPNREDSLARRFQPVVEQCCQPQAVLRPTIMQASDLLEEISRDFNARAQPSTHDNGKLEAFDGLVEIRKAAQVIEPHLPSTTSAAYALAPVPEHAPVSSTACACPDASVRASKHDDRMVYPGFVLTPMPTQVASTLWLLMRWNIYMPEESCCPFHAALLSLKAVHVKLSSMACRNMHDMSEIVSQCPLCGIVSEEMECFFCSGEVTSSPSSPPSLPRDRVVAL